MKDILSAGPQPKELLGSILVYLGSLYMHTFIGCHLIAICHSYFIIVTLIEYNNEQILNYTAYIKVYYMGEWGLQKPQT